MKNLIGISGKIGSGKDTVGKIIQIITDFPKMSTERIISQLDKEFENPLFKNKKFADKLKDCVCLLIGCTREQLEDPEFKNKPLGPEWDCYAIDHQEHYVTDPLLFVDKKQAEEDANLLVDGKVYPRKMTPRLLLQLLGTECGRKIIHPNVWVNASFAEYEQTRIIRGQAEPAEDGEGWIVRGHGKYNGKRINTPEFEYAAENPKYPNWIFTDMRFPNELEAIKKRGGITIRVNRTFFHNEETRPVGFKEHESETALDNSNFDYVVDNNGSLSNLIGKVQAILEMEKIIT